MPIHDDAGNVVDEQSGYYLTRVGYSSANVSLSSTSIFSVL